MASPETETREKALSRFYSAMHHQEDVAPTATATVPFLLEMAHTTDSPDRAAPVALLRASESAPLNATANHLRLRGPGLQPGLRGATAFCPECAAENTILIGLEGYFVAGDPDENASWQALLPAAVDELGGAARRLHARALADGRPVIAEKFTYLFGTAGCPCCETTFQLGTVLTDN